MLKLRDIKKTYIVDEKRFPALKNINLTFPDKGFISILGPSGCGKTTLLNLIGGLDQYTSGDLIINHKSTKKFTDRDWDAYRNKRVGFVFQTYNLVPHLTVLGNVELSMTLTGMSKKERQKKAAIALKRVGLKDTIKKKPNQLSGGQMQRVAIARSLVNNPEIVLADEPTGALDSVTSVQVMEILKEVSKDRLVIMVTHNVELAKQYSTRIIRLKDGKVISDTRPQRGAMKKEKSELEQEKNKHTHMSFFTALGSSARSLLTKKGRTAMTAVAASFGIIGVALVLAMSNGFTNYVGRVEAATASSVPITISPFVTTSIKEIELPPEFPSEETIIPYTENLSQLFTVHHNDITREFADYCKGLLQKPNHFASSVLENHEYLDFNILTKRMDENGDPNGKIIKIDQFKSAGAGGAILSGTTDLPSTIFHELYGDRKYIESLYEVIKGEYPREELYRNEKGQLCCDVCLVCDRYNRIPIKTLYNLGLSPTDTYSDGMKISFDKLLGYEYHAYLPERFYKAVSDTPVEETINSYQLSDDSFWKFSDEIREANIKQYTNVMAEIAGEYLYEDKLNQLYDNISTDPERPDSIVMNIKGILRMKRDTMVNLMPGSVCYPSALKESYLEAVKSDTTFSKIASGNWAIPVADYPSKEAAELTWSTTVGRYAINVYLSGSTSDLVEFLNGNESPIQFYDVLTDTGEFEPPHSFLRLLDPHFTIYQHNNYRFSNDFTVPLLDISGTDEDFHIDIKNVKDLKEGPIDALNFITGYSTITSILIFPKDLSCKHQIFNYIDRWNDNVEQEAFKIQYADLAGTLTDALGTMIDIISIVLICFSSVALLVSCVMTGVITYTSVLERTKEIGILRAIGARKKDVGRLFEAESVIIGGIAGLAGVLFTFIVQWPISLIINVRFPEQQIGMICNLSPWHALILVVISILLTFVAGFIPARKASKKDPVVALRTE